MNKSEIFTTLKKNRKLLHDYGILKIGLFGSYVHETATEESDIDLLVLADDKMSLLKFTELEYELTNILHRKIDLVSINGISKYIKPTILREVEYVEEF